MDSINKKIEITHPQKRIWYNELMFPNTSMHNIVYKIHIDGNLDIHILEKAINLIIEKNDSFRLKFYEEDGKVYQYVSEYKFINIDFLDFTIHNDNAKNKFKEFCTEEGSKILYRQNELLFKCFIYRIDEKNMGICFFIHHFISDGASCNLLFKQLFNVYEQLENNEVIESKVENSYIDFVYEEKEYLNSQEFQENKKFWMDKFSNLNENSLYINSKSAKSKTKLFTLNKDMCVGVKNFLNEKKVSLNKFFISLSSIYMSRILNDNDITLAVACFNRSNERQRSTIGMFTGTMPLRINIEDNNTIDEFLDYLNIELKSCYYNQKYPYDLLVQDLGLKKRGADSLFKFCVNYYVLESYNYGNLNDVSISNEVFPQEYTNIPLHIFVKEYKSDGKIEIEVQYRIEDYTEQQIIQMVKGMEVIADKVIKNSNIKISELQIVSEEEKNIILNKFNNTKRTCHQNKTIKELFEEVAEKAQDKTALVSKGEYLTYKQLNEKANQLASVLVRKGVKKDEIVSILCDRSVDTVVAMLAIIKSGAAYLPIDEDYPKARISYMLEDSRSKILLIKKHQLEKVNLEKANIELIDLNDEEIFKGNRENIKDISSPEDLAYVIYTSGSTGNPKGVCVENRNLVKLVDNPNYIEVKESDKVLQSGSLSFDASVFQIWIALLNGITLHLEDNTLIINDTALEAYIDDNKITLMLMPTPLFNQYSESNISIFKNLRCLIVGGDVLVSKEVSKITEAYKNLKIINAYGPTENAVISTVYEINGQWDESRAVPIGVPIADSTAYIMDKHNNLLPIGVPGELCVGGARIARGYLNREDLTKEKFIENFYVKGERIYKTGDLAKWMPDGNIHFMGRIDHQVKINGFRIELQEIEAQILKYSKVKEAVVADKKDDNGNKYLCGYIVSDEKISSKEIKGFLKKELPNYMIPSYVMRLEKMPVNSNGKIDRKALPVPDLSQHATEFIKPRTEVEQKLEEIWCKLFKTQKVSIKDNFFELGGSSLIAISLVSEIHKELKLKIVVTDVFSNPSIEELAGYLNSVTTNEALSFREIEKVEEREYYEASAVQKRIYAINQRNVNSTNYNIPIAYLIKGNFDKESFETSICELINRHEALRTSFHVMDENVFQKIHSKVDFKVDYIKVYSKFDINKVEVEKLIKPFDLSKAPLIRGNVVEFFDVSILMIDIHHIVADGVSMSIITKELSSLYNGNKLNEIKIQYKDFSDWQSKLYKNGLLESQEKYWIDKFEGEIPKLNVPLDYKNVQDENFQGDTINFEINKALTERINKTITSLGITKFMFYIAAYNVLLYKYTNQEDLIIGTPVAGRTHEGLKDTVGMFVNTLPLRNRIIKNMSFRDLLEQVKETSLEAFENQNYDLKNLIEKLNVKKDSLFNVIFSFQNVSIESLKFNDVQIEPYKLKNNVAKFPISMILNEDKEEILGELEYQAELYKKETIESFAEHYINILTKVIEDLDKPIDELDILSEEEKDIILNKFNNIKKKYHDNKTIKGLFEEVAEKVQDKIALVSKGEYLTYKQLNEKANQLGDLLLAKGVKKDEIIPILCDRSIDTIVAMLAIIKSGAAYLPIDEDYPKARINYMLEDSKSRILLIKKHQLEKVSLEETNVELIDLNDEKIFKRNKENLKNISSPEDLAYVIYTSGSTGNPKGVCIENRNLVRFVDNPDYIEVKESDKVLQSGSLSFDASVFQIWIALLNGITLHVEDKALIINDTALEAYIDDNKITLMLMPTPLFNQYSESNIAIFKNLRCLIVGGDVLVSKAVSRITEAYKNLKIINGYGPTENTILSTAYEVKGQWDKNIAIPIGIPIADSTAYIMDKHNNLLPIGVPGELCVGGARIARGYLNKEELTKEKFIENPYVKGERIYKTGDLAKWMPDGNIHFMGRIDYQVKINGFRVELQEIEAQILKYSKVNEVVVADKKDDSGNKYLCAYVVSDEKISSKEIKDFLKKALPNYMVPSYVMQLEKMPVNSNGKADRKALPIPDLSQHATELIKPRTEMEQKLEQIWCELFKTQEVSIKDNFFELGGNSLTAISLVSKINKELKLKIVVTDVFSNPSIEELAGYLSSMTADEVFNFREIEKVEEREYYEASAVQKRIYAINQRNVSSTNYNIPIVYLIKGNFDKEVFEKSIRQLINRHEALRTSFYVMDENVFQKIHLEVDFKVDYIKVYSKFDINKFEVEKLIRPFDLSKAPLIRGNVIEFSDVSILMLDIHHIVADGVSMSIITKELSSLYNGDKLTDIKIQYKDFSDWQSKLYKNGLLEAQERYWTHKFEGEIPKFNIPLDYKNVQDESFQGDTINFEINKDLTEKINKTITSIGVTKFMFYVAAYNVLLYKYTNQEDLIVGIPAAGRTREELKGTVGMFVNTLPLRNRIIGHRNFRDFLEEVKVTSLEAFENQNYDLKNLIEKLNIEKDSLFNVIFSFQNVNIENLKFNNTEIETYKLKNSGAKFPISMILNEHKGKILGELGYQTALYKKETIENFVAHYINILTKLIDDLDRPIDEFDILSEEEKDLILKRFNNTKRKYERDKTIKELFEEVAEKVQDKTALVSNGECLTYKQLSQRANQLANILVRMGVKKEDIVPILCDKSIDTIVAMLAIIKSGAAYLPIDEDYPKARIDYMIKDSNSKILLIKKHQLEKADLEKVNIKLIDLNGEEILKESKENLQNTNLPEDLAYVIYTSGSTGNPKGVCVENRNLVNFITNANYIKVNEKDKILQAGSLSFDASVLQIWIALLNGITLHLEDKTLIINDTELEEYIDDNEITTMVMPTPLFNQYCESNENIFKNLRCLLAGGDVLSSKQVSKITKRYKDLKIINGYGPTENTVLSTVYEVKGQWNENIAVPIGTPIANSTAYIFDKNNNLLPIGVPGELCVGGDGIARGYLNREELTKEKFIKNPYMKNEIIYKTGDLVKWLPDGNIQFIGRIDYQVKINGFRIELQEIEAELVKYPKVKEAVVADKKDGNGNKYLCAYVVSDEEISSKEIKSFLRKELPNYMIPSYIMQLEGIPMNSSGKVDRKALPTPKVTDLNEEYIAPKNSVEEKISEAWSKVLGLKEISTDLNFFEIGGNSLKAISVISRLAKEFIIAINDIFKYPTIEQLALNVKLKKEELSLKLDETENQVATTLSEEENQIPKAIEPLYHSYIGDIKRYTNMDLNNEVAYKNILLTGATGYVGVNILRELLLATDSKIYLLLRGQDTKEAEDRIIQKTTFYFGQEVYRKYKNRIIILNGNISEKYLGLDINIYENLSSKIDCIINSAANVKHYGRYDEFYNINVLGTKYLLDFAKEGLLKDFNQISTISVGSGSIPNKELVMFSEEDIYIGQESDNVYVRSKLEAEKLVEEASKGSLNTKIFRLGNVTFNYETGMFQENIEENAFYRNIKAFIRLNCIPEIKGNIFDFSYVDQLSKAVILLFNKVNCKNQVFHIENPQKIGTMDLAKILKRRYEKLELKNIDEFRTYISLKSEDEELREYVDDVMVHLGLLENDNSTIFIIGSDRTNEILKKLGFQWGKVSNEAVEKMLDYCEKVNFL